MKIFKVINNNVVSILDEQGNEQIVKGKGIGFQKKTGDIIEKSSIEKRFILSDNSEYDHYATLLKQMPIEILNFVSDALDHAGVVLNKRFTDTTIISLADHIFATMVRYEKNCMITNPILWELKRYYKAEYEMAMEIIDMINDQFNIQLPEDEVGFITVHLVELDTGNIETVSKITKLIQEISNIVKYYFNVEFDTDSIHYYRFITHIKFFSQRVILDKTGLESNDDSLFEIIKNKYVNAYGCVKSLQVFLKKQYNFDMSNEEKLYLMIHIQRVIYQP